MRCGRVGVVPRHARAHEGQRVGRHVEVDLFAVEVARAHEGEGRHHEGHRAHVLAHAAREPARENAGLGRHGKGEVVVEEGSEGPGVDTVEGAGADGVGADGLDLLDEGGVAALAEQGREVAGVVAEVLEQLDRAGGGLEGVEGAGELVEVRGDDARDQRADVCQGLGLDGVDQLGDVVEVRVERAAREASALRDGRDRDARQVAGGGDLCHEGVAQARPAAPDAAVETNGSAPRGKRFLQVFLLRPPGTVAQAGIVPSWDS